MTAPLTIEQIILNHNVGVNISDADTLDGHPITDFALIGHRHSADDVTSGTLSPDRLPVATENSRGVVALSNSTDSNSKTLAVTPYALLAVKNMISGKAGSSHTHSPSEIREGAFTSMIQAYSNNNYGSRQIRNIYLSSSTPSSSTGSNGDIWLQWS